MSAYNTDKDYETILKTALNNSLLSEYDKREGSLAYDAMAPFSMELAKLYAQLDIFTEQSYLLTATGENLDNRAYDNGITRKSATKAKRIGRFISSDDEEITPAVGTRFFVQNDDVDDEQIIFTYTGIEDGNKILECQTAGSKGNEYSGVVVAMDYVSNLKEARITGTYELGEDEESDESLRTRVQSSLVIKSFGGNIQDYLEELQAMAGVGNAKIFPAFLGDGTVLCSVVSSSYDPIDDDKISEIKEALDPTDMTGTGVGIVPIGHKVTVSTPVKSVIDVHVKITLAGSAIVSEASETLDKIIEEVFEKERKRYAQDVTLYMYRSSIIASLVKSDLVVNVSSILLNGFEEDITFTDTAEVGGQALPYVGVITYEQTN